VLTFHDIFPSSVASQNEIFGEIESFDLNENESIVEEQGANSRVAK